MKLLKYTLTIGALAFCCMANGQKSSGAAQFPELTPDVRGVGMVTPVPLPVQTPFPYGGMQPRMYSRVIKCRQDTASPPGSGI